MHNMLFRCVFSFILVISLITNKHCFFLTSNLTQFWSIDYPLSMGSNGIGMVEQDLENLLSLESSPSQVRNQYDLRECQRIDNHIEIMILLTSNKRQGYWLYCSQPNIPSKNMFDGTLQKSASTNTGLSISTSTSLSTSKSISLSASTNNGLSSINGSLSYSFSIPKFSSHQFLGKRKANYFNGQINVYLACNLTEKDFRIIDVSECTLQIETEIFK